MDGYKRNNHEGPVYGIKLLLSVVSRYYAWHCIAYSRGQLTVSLSSSMTLTTSSFTQIVETVAKSKRTFPTAVMPSSFYCATRMHSADYAVARCLSVCSSVCLLHASILSTPLNISSKCFYHQVAPPF